MVFLCMTLYVQSSRFMITPLFTRTLSTLPQRISIYLYLVIDDKIIAITECCHCAPDLDAHVLGSTYE